MDRRVSFELHLIAIINHGRCRRPGLRRGMPMHPVHACRNTYRSYGGEAEDASRTASRAHEAGRMLFEGDAQADGFTCRPDRR